MLSVWHILILGEKNTKLGLYFKHLVMVVSVHIKLFLFKFDMDLIFTVALISRHEVEGIREAYLNIQIKVFIKGWPKCRNVRKWTLI